MYLSIGLVAFFAIAIFLAGVMIGCILVAGKETDQEKRTTKVIRISEDIESSMIYPNIPDWKKTVEN
jgi:hypothetical protein